MVWLPRLVRRGSSRYAFQARKPNPFAVERPGRVDIVPGPPIRQYHRATSRGGCARECRAILSPESPSDHHRRPRLSARSSPFPFQHANSGNVCPHPRTPWMEIYRERTDELVGDLFRRTGGQHVAAGRHAGAYRTGSGAAGHTAGVCQPMPNILDVPCGGGRIAMALGRARISETGRGLVSGVPGVTRRTGDPVHQKR